MNPTDPQSTVPTPPALENGVHELAIADGLTFALGQMASQLKREAESVATDKAEAVKDMTF